MATAQEMALRAINILKRIKVGTIVQIITKTVYTRILDLSVSWPCFIARSVKSRLGSCLAVFSQGSQVLLTTVLAVFTILQYFVAREHHH